MDLDAHGVAQPVAEAALVARAVDDIPGNLVHLAAFVTRFGESAAGELRLQTVSYTFFCSSDTWPTATVRVISVQYPSTFAPKSMVTKSPASMRLSPGTPCGRLVLPRDKDRVERQLARAVALHKHFHLQRGVDFPHAGFDVAQHVLEAGVGDDLRAADGVEFFLGLDGPDGVDGVREHSAGVHLHARQRGATRSA